MADGVRGLAEYIASIARKKQGNATFYGRVSGSNVAINNTYYPFTVAVDVPANDGDYVWCVLNQSKTLAVVIGG